MVLVLAKNSVYASCTYSVLLEKALSVKPGLFMNLTASLLIFDSIVPWFVKRFLLQISVSIWSKSNMHYENKSLRDMRAVS